HRLALEGEVIMVESAVFKAVRCPDSRRHRRLAKQHQCPIEQVRAKVREHTTAGVAPGGGAYISGGAVSVEELDLKDFPEPTCVKGSLESDDVRLEAMVIRGVTDGLVLFGDFLELL